MCATAVMSFILISQFDIHLMFAQACLAATVTRCMTKFSRHTNVLLYRHMQPKRQCPGMMQLTRTPACRAIMFCSRLCCNSRQTFAAWRLSLLQCSVTSSTCAGLRPPSPPPPSPRRAPDTWHGGMLFLQCQLVKLFVILLMPAVCLLALCLTDMQSKRQQYPACNKASLVLFNVPLD